MVNSLRNWNKKSLNYLLTIAICQAVMNSSNTYSKVQEDRHVGNWFLPLLDLGNKCISVLSNYLVQV